MIRAFPLFLVLLIATLCPWLASGDNFKMLADVPRSEPDGKYSGKMLEYYADRCHAEKSYQWSPGVSEPLLPVRSLIQIAKERVEIPKGEFPYSAAEFVGADLRRLADDDYWYWEIHFLFNIDITKIEGRSLRDGTINRSVLLLPTGGVIQTKERDLTPTERIQFGLDQDPNAKDPFAPDA